MKTSLVSLLVGICLTGVQAELPYNMPEWRRGVSPPIVPPDHPKWEYPHHHPTGKPHHQPTGVHLPGHHRPPPSYPTGGHPTKPTGHPTKPTGYPTKPTTHPTKPTGYPQHPPRGIPVTFKTVTGTGGHAYPTGFPGGWHHHQCKHNHDCKDLVCAMGNSMKDPNKGPKCMQGREGKFCACAAGKTE
ncbi:hypothetical protein F5Y04DRAFT_80202 [Hypomontagnella monticulosa]|nr:hypothetical protein F5Y04DRAFT_80202 [Hypomontagnella monticulosa]